MALPAKRSDHHSPVQIWENLMDSPSIVILGVLLVSGGGVLLLYNRSRRHSSSEIFFNGLGVVLVACGLAVVRDGATGSRHILWMLHDQAHHSARLGTNPLDLPK
ncbi:hypothetical protein [Hyphomicrobium sp.]|uniref:hypothetical protein n=1 Tax=Hyphomicrobium sp. TaxID=82 RepID=UPI002FDF2369